MICVCKLFSLDTPAQDGSVIPTHVAKQYIESPEAKRDMENRLMLGTLSHRTRALTNCPESIRTSTITKSIGKDDLMIIPESGCSCPTHYIFDMWIDGGWVWCKIKILEEEGFDEIGKKYIQRLKGLLKQGVHLPLSLVVVAFWESVPGSSVDRAKNIRAIRGCDITLNESFKGAGVVEILDDNGEKMFSNNESSTYTITAENTFDGSVKVKTFSSPYLSGIDVSTPKSSKIDGKIAFLKAKEFSVNGSISLLEDDKAISQQKEFSVTSIKERVRYAKFNPRQRFRRLVMEYKAVVKSLGGVEKMDEETLKVMKSLFATDILDIMKSITPEIIKGKPIGTLIGASSLGKNVRITTQKMQMPMKMALQQAQKQNYVTKNIYEKIQALYSQFIQDLTEEVFSSKSTIPDLKEEDMMDEQETNEK